VASSTFVKDIAIDNVIATAEGATNTAVAFRLFGEDILLERVEAIATGGGIGPTGIIVNGHSIIRGANVYVGPGDSGSIGVAVYGTGEISESFVQARDGGTGVNASTVAIQVNTDESYDIRHSRADASSALGRAYALNPRGDGIVRVSSVVLDASVHSPNPVAVAVRASSNVKISNSVLNTFGTGLQQGIQTSTSSPIEISVISSEIVGATNSVWANGGSVNVVIGTSQLSGGPMLLYNGATIVCAGVFDENHTFFTNSCP
jgi:hypothetical protein